MWIPWSPAADSICARSQDIHDHGAVSHNCILIGTDATYALISFASTNSTATSKLEKANYRAPHILFMTCYKCNRMACMEKCLLNYDPDHEEPVVFSYEEYIKEPFWITVTNKLDTYPYSVHRKDNGDFGRVDIRLMGMFIDTDCSMHDVDVDSCSILVSATPGFI
ncbi:hypothetical protein GcC1_047023 [Golovinomyces cichoracearum]|uniref:Uncharacterized protein n=1 Tax=Golovinomyces cichoracearum TaxID=62708 RepID=A0A420IXU7_9PEZI|nr:hypothetical protein GcC1_047023 [Golovinomyces cichoracearum]